MNHQPWLQKKLVDPNDLENKLVELRSRKKTIATLNGSFDLLHAGHLYIIHQASLQADCLLVALNSDASIKQYKSVHRPIIGLMDRLSMVAALEFVHLVTWFDETDPRVLLHRIRPDVHVNGAEYGDFCIEAETVRQGGGRLHLVDRVPGLATTAVIEKIRQLDGLKSS